MFKYHFSVILSNEKLQRQKGALASREARIKWLHNAKCAKWPMRMANDKWLHNVKWLHNAKKHNASHHVLKCLMFQVFKITISNSVL